MGHSIGNTIRRALLIASLVVVPFGGVLASDATIAIHSASLTKIYSQGVFDNTPVEILASVTIFKKTIATQAATSTPIAAPAPLSAPTLSPLVPGPVQILGGNWDTFRKGFYWSFNSTWGQPAGTTINKEFTQRIIVDQTNFPALTIIDWDYSNVDPAAVWSGVFAYPEIVYGETPGTPGGFGSEAVITNPGGPWPMQLKNIKTLQMTFDFIKTGPTPNNSNVMMEFYARDVATPTDYTHEKFEIMFLLAPDQATRGYNADVNNGAIPFSTPGYSGMVRITKNANPPIIGFAPTKDIFKGTIDVKACIDFLIAKGWVSGDLWLSGLQFGVEPRSNIDGGPAKPWSGTVKINNLSYVWN